MRTARAPNLDPRPHLTAVPLHRDGHPCAEPPFPLFTATGWSAPELVGVTGVGELDLATAPLLAAEIRAVCRANLAGDVREFLLDLEGVTFLDSTGLRCAERAELAATNGGWHVQVRPPTARGPQQLLLLAHPQRDGQEPGRELSLQ